MAGYLLKMRPSYCFDDVLLLPKHSNINSRKEVDLTCELSADVSKRTLKLKSPLISSPMDTVTDSNMAISMALNGGLGIIHRFMDEFEQIKHIEEVKRYVQYIFTDPYTISENTTICDLINYLDKINVKTLCVMDDDNHFTGIVTSRDCKNLALLDSNIKVKYIMTPLSKLITISINCEQDIKWGYNGGYENYLTKARDLMIKHKVEKIPIILPNNELYGIITERSVKYYFDNKQRATLDDEGRLCCGIAVGVANVNWSHIDLIVETGVDLLCVDVANGHNQNCIDMVAELRKRYPNIIIMAGNIVTGEGLQLLSDAGVDCVRIGIGNGSICSTRLQTGVGFGQFSAVNEVFEWKNDNNLPVKLICDGGSLGKIGNKMKALASGADAVILGRSLASCIESPGMIINRNGKRVKYFRGMASKMASMSKSGDKAVKGTAEGVDGVVEVRGSVADTVEEICGGIRSGMSYQGCRSLFELHDLRSLNKIEWALSTPVGLSETGIRIKTF